MKRQKNKNIKKQQYKKFTRREKEYEARKIKSVKVTKSENKISKKMIFFWLAVISILTIFAYYPSFDNEITSWDDDEYITKNKYLKDLSFENIKNIFTDKSFMGNYHPLTLVSLSVDYSIVGEDEKGEIKPFMYHFTNVLLHLFVTLLVFWFVYELFDKLHIAIIVALLFGVHTLHVESVAWISERKDVLYSLFFVASLIAYVKFVDSKKYLFYIISFFLFVLSLFSKGQAVSLAVTIFAIDYLKNRDFWNVKIFLEKLPFWLLAVIFGLLAINAQKEGNAIISEEAYSFLQRIGFAGYAFMQYLIQLVAPVKLSAIYPYPDIINKTMPAYYWLFLLPAITVFVAPVFLFKKSKEITFSIAFFIINIFLLLQFIPVGSAIHADRYVYIPSIGFFIFIAWIIHKIIQKNEKMKIGLFSVVGIFTVFLIFLTINRTEIWKNSETLWNDTVEKSPKAVVAWNNRGSLRDKQAAEAEENFQLKKSEILRRQAISDFTVAIKGKPDYSHAFYNRGSSRHELGKQIKDKKMLKNSIKDFTDALHFKPTFPAAFHNRGNAKSELGMLEDAMKDYNMAISLKKDDANFYVNRGVTRGKIGKLKEAVSDFDKAVKLDPFHKSVYSNRGLAKAKLGESKAAIKDYDMAIKVKPEFYTAYYNRAITKYQIGDLKGSLDDLNFVIKTNNKFVEAYYWRGLCLFKLNRKDKACNDFHMAYKSGIAKAKQLIDVYCKN